jgi:uncharacterized membrane protein
MRGLQREQARRTRRWLRLLAAVAAYLAAACGSSQSTNSTPPAPASADAPAAPARQSRDPWRDAEARGIDFRAVGQEPGWFAEIDEGRSLRLVYDYGERQAVTAVGGAVVEQGTTVYRSTTGNPAVVVAIEHRSCGDAMSGQPFPSTVTVTIDGRALHGCGRPLRRARAWQASARQVGPVRIGMTIAEAEAALGSPFDAAVDSGECVFRQTPAAPTGVLFMLIAGRVARIDVTSFDVRTDRGAGVGDSEMAVQDAYGTNVAVTPHKYNDGHYLTVPAGDHRIVFETDGQWVTRYRVGRLPEIGWVEGCS